MAKVAVGERVAVEGLGQGTVRFVGAHHTKEKKRVGVELDTATGTSKGKFGGHRYFKCEAKGKRAVLVAPKKVTKVDKDTGTKPKGTKAKTKSKKEKEVAEKESKKSKKEKKAKKGDKAQEKEAADGRKSTKRKHDSSADTADAGPRLDWTQVRMQGDQSGERKEKFLRLMGGASKAGNGSIAAGAKPGGVIAMLMSKKAPKSEKFIKSGLFTGKATQTGGGRADVNSGYRVNKDLLQQAEQAQNFLKNKRKFGGSMGFSQ